MENSGNMKKELDKVYSPTEIEDKWYKIWEENGYFSAQHNDEKPGYSIVIPPPNVTGILHMGHMLDNTIQDAIIRYKRMSGFDTLWVPGMDHAGIATQNKVERMLKEQGTSKEEIGRDEFLKKTWEWKEKHGGLITKQLRKLGVSPDWSRERFTMDEGLSRAVKEVFIKLYNDGLIYRGEYIVNWCPHDKTALADDEVNHFEKNGKIWEIKYPIKDSDGYVVIATTRPETMLGDTGVAVNPNDERYKDLIGKKVILPLMDREIPVVADEYVDMEFGTGVVKMTPSHDPNDFEVAKRTGLPFLNIFTEDAKVNENGGKYCGLERFEARKAILKDLEEQGYLVGVKEHKNAVGHCYRCDSVIEPRVSTQWFVKMKPLAERALEVVKNGKIQITPKRWEKVYYNWLENIRDWTISRQIWWGHRIPAYYAEDGSIFVARDLEEAKAQAREKFGKDVPLREETDVLDTWFSSALWPFSTMGWPDKTKDLEKFFPTNVLVTGADILFFWVARMVMMSLYINDEIPFDYVYLHGLIRDEQGRKMSKSLGNSPDPLDLIDKYGADAIRFSFLYNTSQGQDIHFSEKLLEMGSAFANKVWNASRFVLMNLNDEEKYDVDLSKIEIEDKWILTRLNRTIEELSLNLSKFEFGLASAKIYDFIWNEFCDWYIEFSKTRLYGDNLENKLVAKSVLVYVLNNILKLLHPFMPFVTEEIWQQIAPRSTQEALIVASYPKEEAFDESLLHTFEFVQEIISGIRTIRKEKNIAFKEEISLSVIDNEHLGNQWDSIIQKLGNISSISYTEKTIEGAISFRVKSNEYFIPILDKIDVAQEIEKLEKELSYAEGFLKSVRAKLSNEKFVNSAPAQVVENERKKEADALAKIETIQKSIENLR